MKILLSTHPYQVLGRNFGDMTVGEHTVVVRPRTAYQSRDITRPFRDFSQAVNLLRQASTFDALVLVLPGLEALLIATLHSSLAPELKIVHFDPGRILGLPPPWLKLAGHCLEDVDSFACVRRGDIGLLERQCGIEASRSTFVPFPLDETVLEHPVADEGYIYSAGLNRDWKTLIAALEKLPYRAILSGARAMAISRQARGRIEILPQQHPKEGRLLMSRARLVVLPLASKNVLSGQLVLLDALTLGKALVASDTPGTRDYLQDGKTAILVPPEDAVSLGSSIVELMENHSQRKTIAQAGKEHAFQHFSPERCLADIVKICASL